MEKLNFRTLQADEIDCRIAMVKENGLSLLLYKDARVDQNILDEAVGPMNWQRHHSRDNANCTVAVWDNEKGQWIEKEDTGTESYTEKEKGLASDSFKRACFNWGIGRELYTAPFIWIDTQHCNIKASGNKFTCSDSFYVSQIGYDKKRNINALTINKSKGHSVVFTMGKIENKAGNKPGKSKETADSTQPEPAAQKQDTVKNTQSEFPAQNTDKITAPMIASIKTLIDKYSSRGLKMEKILTTYHIKTIEEMTLEAYKDCMNKMKNYEEEPKHE